MTRALVTGGAGFIGSHIVEKLVRKGWEVAVLDDLSSGSVGNIGAFLESVEFIEGSITDAGTVRKLMDGVDYVFHEAAVVSVVAALENPEKARLVNVGGTRNVLGAALDAGVKRVVFASSATVYGDADPPLKEDFRPSPLSFYGETKVEGEQLMNEYAGKGLETVSLRYFNVYGPRQEPSSPYSGVITKFIDRMAAGKPPLILGDGNQTRDFVYVGDVADANVLAAEGKEAAGRAFNIGTGLPVTINQLEGLLSEIIGFDGEPEYAEKREGDIYDSYADVSRAEKLLGFKAAVATEDGLRKTVEWQGSL